MCEIEFDPEDWEKGWEMDADEAEDLLDQYDDLIQRWLAAPLFRFAEQGHYDVVFYALQLTNLKFTKTIILQ